MAKDRKPKKEPGRWGQIFKLFRETIRVDKAALWLVLLATISSLGVGAALIIFTSLNNIILSVVYGVLAVTAAMMFGLLVLSRRAEGVAYSKIEGQPGAVGAVVTTAIRRGWRTSEVPVAVNPRTRDAIYRAVGAAGIVLIAEGSRSGTKTILDEEIRKLGRATPGVSIHVFYVTGDDTGTPLAKLGREVTGLKRTLNRSEISLVNARLQAMGTKLPIPKGIDPKRIRPVRR
jgi:hypothetical protein